MATVNVKVTTVHRTEVALVPGGRQSIGQIIDHQISFMASDMDEEAELSQVAVDLTPTEWSSIRDRLTSRVTD